MVGISGRMEMTAKQEQAATEIEKKCSGAECEEELIGTFRVTPRVKLF